MTDGFYLGGRKRKQMWGVQWGHIPYSKTRKEKTGETGQDEAKTMNTTKNKTKSKAARQGKMKNKTNSTS